MHKLRILAGIIAVPILIFTIWLTLAQNSANQPRPGKWTAYHYQWLPISQWGFGACTSLVPLVFSLPPGQAGKFGCLTGNDNKDFVTVCVYQPAAPGTSPSIAQSLDKPVLNGVPAVPAGFTPWFTLRSPARRFCKEMSGREKRATVAYNLFGDGTRFGPLAVTSTPVEITYNAKR